MNDREAEPRGLYGKYIIYKTTHWFQRDVQIGQALEAITRAIALLKDIERIAEEAN